MSLYEESKPSSIDGKCFPHEVKCFYENKNGNINIIINGYYSKDFDEIIDYLREKQNKTSRTIWLDCDFGKHFCENWSIEMKSELHEIVRYSIMFKDCIKPISI
jgi:hypothetical protein